MTRLVRIPLRVANSYLVIGEKTIIVDTGDPGYAKGILRALSKEKIDRRDVSLIFITHGHIDHFGSVFELKRSIDAPIVIQRHDEPYLNRGVQGPLYAKNRLAAFMKRIGGNFSVPKRYGFTADLTFDHHMDLQPYGVEGELIATPGHTLGSASLVLADGRAIVGDLLVRRYFLAGPPAIPPFLQDGRAFYESIRRLDELGVHSYYPGHGGQIKREEFSLKSNSNLRL